MQTDDFRARAQHQMKGVAQYDRGAQTLELLGCHALDRAVGTDRHERRCLDRAMGQLQACASRGAVAGEHLKAQPHDGARPGVSTSIASP